MAGMAIMLAAVCLNATCGNNSGSEMNGIGGLNTRNSEYITQIIDTRASTLMAKLNGSVLRVVTLEDRPISYTEIIDGELIGRGVAFRVLEYLMEKFNFTYTLVKPARNVIGSRDDYNGSLLEVLYRNESDLAVAFVPTLSETSEFIKHSATVLDEGEWIMLMRRPAISATGSGLMAPFTLNVWLMVLLASSIVGPLIYVMIILRNRITRDYSQPRYALPHCMWFIYGALVKQGCTLEPVADSTRMIFATWWLFITLLTSFYTANLTAFLTLSKFTLPINNFDDIYQSQKPFVALKGGCVEYAVLNVNGSHNYMRRMYERKRAVFTDKPDNETLNEYVLEEDFVLIRDRPAVNHLMFTDYHQRKLANPLDERKQCPFATAKHPFMRRIRSFAYHLDSDYNKLFDKELLSLVEAGIVKYWLSENVSAAQVCPENLGSTERQLRNSDLAMTYWITLSGYGVAAVILFTEIIFKFLNARFNLRDGAIQISKQIHSKYASTAATTTMPNVTPPPAYATLFKRSRNKIWTSDDFVQSMDDSGGVKQTINGRDYIVFKNEEGESRLVPLRTPSAALFQYAYTK